MDKEEVLRLSRLARVDITNEEAGALSREFDAILGYVGEIKNAKTSSLESDSQGETLRNVMREDANAHESGVYTEELLAEAPMREGDFVRVKKIL